MGGIKESLFGTDAFMHDMNAYGGRWIVSSTIFRGNVSSSEISTMTNEVNASKSSYFVEWLPNNVSNDTICYKPPRANIMSGTLVSNHTSK